MLKLVESFFKAYKWNVSLYLGDQLLVFDFVAIFRFLSWRCGPVRLISTYGRKTTPDGLAHLRSFAAMTEKTKFRLIYISGMAHAGALIPLTVTLCSPDPACVNKSTCIETSPITSSSTFVESTTRNVKKFVQSNIQLKTRLKSSKKRCALSAQQAMDKRHNRHKLLQCTSRERSKSL